MRPGGALAEIFRRQAFLAVLVEGQVEDLGSKLPGGCIAEPDDIARVACFLASEAYSYVFGSSLYIDGGQRRATP